MKIETNGNAHIRIVWFTDDGRWRILRGTAGNFELDRDFNKNVNINLELLGSATIADMAHNPMHREERMEIKNPTFKDIQDFMNEHRIPETAQVRVKKNYTEFIWND